MRPSFYKDKISGIEFDEFKEKVSKLMDMSFAKTDSSRKKKKNMDERTVTSKTSSSHRQNLVLTHETGAC